MNLCARICATVSKGTTDAAAAGAAAGGGELQNFVLHEACVCLGR